MWQALRSLLGFFVFLITLGFIASLGAAYYVYQELHKPISLNETMIIEVPHGAGLNQIAYGLERDGLTKSRFLFIIAAKMARAETDLKAGEYEINSGMNLMEILAKLRSHNVVQRFVTVREGLTSYEIVQLLNAHEELEGDAIEEIPTEGTLLPETYSYSKGETRTDILKHMQDAMSAVQENTPVAPCADTQTENENINACLPAPLKSWNEVITLASIVEKETGVPEERERIAGVFLNRLRKNIPLQTDPTVIYAITLGEHDNKGQGPLGRRLLKKDLEIDSPYNTYKYPGLPPGPIANPGKAAIDAVLNPEENDFIYFVADGSGGHAFAKTLAEHNANVAKWRQIRKKQN